jgi:hypothetical protein
MVAVADNSIAGNNCQSFDSMMAVEKKTDCEDFYCDVEIAAVDIVDSVVDDNYDDDYFDYYYYYYYADDCYDDYDDLDLDHESSWNSSLGCYDHFEHCETIPRH